MKNARIRIRRGIGQGLPGSILRGIAAVCLLGLALPLVAPLWASRPVSGLTIRLAPPKPIDILSESFKSGALVQDAPGTLPTMLVSGPAAVPFYATGSAQDRLRASICLTAAIYYEAGQEPDAGQRAVAQVILNRVRHPAFPDTVCGVVYQGTERSDTLCQFTFGCDGSLVRGPMSSAWGRAWKNAQTALSGAVYEPVGLSTHYHTLAVNPGWSRSLTPTAIVGAHIFYRWPGGAGSPAAFRDAYRGLEPVPAPRVKPEEPKPPIEPVIYETVEPIGPAASTAAALPNDRYVAGSLPLSDVKDEYRSSGSWKKR